MNIVHVLHTVNDRPLKAARVELLTRRLPEAMQSHVRKFRRWQDYQASLFGKLLLYECVVNICGMKAHVLDEITLTEHLKPVLPGTNIHFSIAHSGILVACAVGNTQLGLDVERIQSISPNDLHSHLPAGHGTWDFFERWTMAEAVLKGSGQGLHHSMADIVVRENRREASFNGRTWHLSPLLLHDGYRACLAAAEPVVVVTEFQPPIVVASLTQREEKGLEQEILYGL